MRYATIASRSTITAPSTAITAVRLVSTNSSACRLSVWNSSGWRRSFRVSRWSVRATSLRSGEIAEPSRRTTHSRRPSHLVLEVFGRHLLEDLGPLVARNVGEVLLFPLL